MAGACTQPMTSEASGLYGLLVMIEAIRQVRGECGARQVPHCHIAFAHGNGGVLSSQCGGATV
jgi:hypothetical protein